MSETGYSPLIELTRGEVVESIHYGALAVVNPQGDLLAAQGDPQRVTFLRSAAKPFQLLPFIEAGGHKHYNFSQREIALMCASHSGTDEHVALLNKIQAQIGITQADLMCGVHPPHDKTTADAMLLRGEGLTPNRHNCSGKHTGMLAFAKMNGEPMDTYLEPDHPVQQRILQTFAEMCGLSVDQVQLGTDGCSAPNFAVPLYNAALGWARLVDPTGLSPARAEACRTITQAMMAYPFMVAGPNRFDTAIMQAAEGHIVTKAGAEGYEGMGVMPGVLGEGSGALGISVKISDGDGRSRATAATSIEVLRQLGAIDTDELAALQEYGPVREIKNWRELVVGEMHPVFSLNLN